MARTSNKRERLLDAAKTLIHRQGFYRTTLADIANESEVPLGNVYYYFKTKEEILETVLEQRWQKLQGTLNSCCVGGPRENLIQLVKTVSKSSNKIAEFGCVIGSLCQELDKTQSELRKSADRIMHAQIDWASSQFREMGLKKHHEAGFALIARLEGTMLLGHALQEPRLIKQQLKAICAWIKSL
jgi:AcrR family transcriptional regulator